MTTNFTSFNFNIYLYELCAARGAVPNKDKNAEERVPGQPNPNQPNRVGGGTIF